MNRLLPSLLALATLAFANAAQAELKGSDQWRPCQQDTDCVLVQGMCNKTAVNKFYAADATAFYQEHAKGTRCPQKFWVPKVAEVRCHLGSCATAAGNSP